MSFWRVRPLFVLSFWCSDLLRDGGSISRSSSPSMNCYFLGTFSFGHFYAFQYMFQCVCCSLGTKSLTLSSPLLVRENKGWKQGKQGYFRGLEKVSDAKIPCNYMSHVHRFCLENVNATWCSCHSFDPSVWYLSLCAILVGSSLSFFLGQVPFVNQY